MCYEDLDCYDSYLVRGYAVVCCAGLGTRGSDGFNGCGMYEEKMAFASVIQWLHGDRTAYTTLTSDIAVKPEWCSGLVGMTGRSYGGTMPYAIACEGIEGLKAIVPLQNRAAEKRQNNSLTGVSANRQKTALTMDHTGKSPTIMSTVIS